MANSIAIVCGGYAKIRTFVEIKTIAARRIDEIRNIVLVFILFKSKFLMKNTNHRKNKRQIDKGKINSNGLEIKVKTYGKKKYQ